MSKEDNSINLTGVVTDSMPGGSFRVKITDNHEVIAKASGKIRQNSIQIIVGDRVEVVVSPYDLYKGRITFRYKD